MRLCFSTRVEAGRALENGENPEIVFEGGNLMDVSGDPTEDGILQFPNLRNFPCNDRTEATGENPEIVFEGGNNMNVSGDPTEDKILKFDNLREFLFSDLRAATGFFDEDSLLGIGAFGSVYKGWIDMHSFTAAKPGTGMAIAVKKLMPGGTQGQQEWLVALGAAKGLAFVHNEAHVIHRDFKTSDILLDLNFNAKISDFGLAKDGPTGVSRTPVTTSAFGNHGYAAPECFILGHVSAKSDVYSFGVVLLEVLTGQRAVDPGRPKGKENLVEWATPYLNNKHKVFQILDTYMADHFFPTSVLHVTNLVLRCLSEQPKLRPDMEGVAKELEEIHSTIDNERSREHGS